MEIENKIIVNFTTYPKRDMYMPKMLENFKNQTIKPNKIILWLSEDEYEKDNLPKHIEKCLTDRLLTDIMWVKKNIFCHKRHECFKYFNSCFNVFIDDDTLYPSNFLKELITEAKEHPNAISCYWSRGIDYEGINIIQSHCFIGESQKNSFLGHGCCFPPNIFPIESFDYEELRDKYVTKCDEGWLKAFFIKKNININAMNDLRKIKTIDESQDSALYNENKQTYEDGMREKERNFFNALKIINAEEEAKKIFPKISIDKWELRTAEELKKQATKKRDKQKIGIKKTSKKVNKTTTKSTKKQFSRKIHSGKRKQITFMNMSW